MRVNQIPILITRAEPGARETALRVEALGLNAVKSSVLEIQARLQEQLPDLRSLAGLVFTSANGVRAFTSRSADRDLGAWCVGPATATAARAAGFSVVHESSGNAVDLAKFIAKHTAPSDAPLLHIANHAAKGDLQRTLKEQGFQVDFAPLYEMRVATALSDAAMRALTTETPVIALIHSAKGAEAFARLCGGIRVRNLNVVAISDKAAQPLNALSPKEIQVAGEPNEDGLFTTLASGIATLSA